MELDSTGLLKLNPLYTWTFDIVDWYIKEHNVPHNALLQQGYKSIGDWHSTVKVKEGEDERAGRWAGREKTECGLHEDYFVKKRNANVVCVYILSCFYFLISSRLLGDCSNLERMRIELHRDMLCSYHGARL